MSDNLPIVWPAEPHTRAKHAILKRYLQAWMAILSRQSRLVPSGSKSILYVDGFAGPGVYTGNEPGSPIIAIQTALKHQQRLPVPVRFLFIELDADRFRSLQTQIAKLEPKFRNAPQVAGAEARHGDCATVLGSLANDPRQLGGKFGPAMVFLDQFGYSEVPIELIARIMSWDQCEVLTYLNWDHLNRFMSDPPKASGITAAFGSERWREAIPLAGDQRRTYLLNLYRDALSTSGGAKYVLDFAMCDENGSLLYWLFFGTNHPRGLEEMKKAMWTVDRSGSFRFSDSDHPGQLLLLSAFDDQWLAVELAHRLSGQTLTVQEVKDFVLIETPCYLFKGALKKLESKGAITPIGARPGRRLGTYTNEHFDLKMRFEPCV